MANKYTLAPEAVEDLRAIAHYTQITWGSNQSKAYETKLVNGFQTIVDGSPIAKPFKGTNTDLFFVRCEHHYIFYLQGTNPLAIVAILHERMDFIVEIKKRLNA